MTDPWQRLGAALDAYAVVAPRDSRFRPAACGHCHTAEELAALAGPVESVPGRLLAAVAYRSPGHWSDPTALLRRLAPRLMRAVVAGGQGVGAGSLGTRFRQADWPRWPEPERVALLTLWRTWFDLTVRHDPAPVPVDEVLDLVATATGGLAPWLDRWPAAGHPVADRRLAELLDGWVVHDRADALRLGHGGEYLAGSELFTWLNGLDPARLTPDQRYALALLDADRP
ncbi:hypothetical protein ACIRBX_08905 [Kitasatospora sp. NPDC096147]|uniref:hypothetical protein n=1 Tax=Kitasatospora sp. NPDC096147 TaxID=3364093 RepID=UPI003813973F